jgi:NAD(P)-dependent dehydrogenase (short-subunit alcohol dehydrogenase family)
VFANAGFGGVVPLGSVTEEHFDTIFGINVRGLLFTVQKALPLFTDGGSTIGLTFSFSDGGDGPPAVE